jgi:hypothetical protein
MVGTKIISGSKPRWFMAISIAMLLAILIACGNSDEPSTPAPAAASNSDNDQPKSILDAVASDNPVDADDDINERLAAKPVDAEMVKIQARMTVEPEEGSDEAAILKVVRAQVLAYNLDNPVDFLKGCDPRLAKPNGPEDVVRLWSTFTAPFAPERSFNVRILGIRFFDDDTALVESDLYSYDEQILGTIAESWVTVDGGWYLSNVFCHNGNSILKS